MHAIALGNEEFEGKNNAYLLEGEPVTLLDTGIATDRTREQLREELAERGIDFSDIDQVILTHFHPDHAGLAGKIQRESGATVYAHAADAPLIEQRAEALAELDERRRELFNQWGMPDAEREELLAFLDSHQEIMGQPADVTRISEGDRIETGEMALETLHTPGHAAGLCCFAFEGDGPEAFVGDAVLPVYTPNVGGADVRIDAPLERYVDSLRTLIERDFERVWPGHRDVIDEPAERARYIVSHHRERTERVLGVLEDGPADAWTVSAELFGDLEGIHVMHGPGEAFAHLDHLERAGHVEREDAEYVLTTEPDLETLLALP
ncbi:MBL fold metallo-hydrolase [Halalkalicoccus jeotgali]|uniref:Beta-lactamase domain protein n=1 Tax=Halalkalicoccus jeotgali (strain DSM 18796 / CECT 7217 / JCM 14584 / KCTC 4019 / B3) TaxID=795797 RepID=D8J6D5_HALJB|nr:MBL fold metallo-hydrolase [Halalkalicoccus jeotgali]ADJ15853.1 beta-lactamase domain protein [Halalkalicoccus jeotgali B3]ELY37949.1 beta-lactamase domain-containing protein [Halalkalicoccus jeotgali B3]